MEIVLSDKKSVMSEGRPSLCCQWLDQVKKISGWYRRVALITHPLLLLAQ